MEIESFWQHWQVTEDPFRAEEARNDPVFARLMSSDTTAPDFEKIFAQADRPSSAVVFGEKGSGKTALKLLLKRRIEHLNAEREEGRIWVVRYDDLNPVLDRFAHSMGHRGRNDQRLLERFRLPDHQDAILSLVVTDLVNTLVAPEEVDPESARDGKEWSRRLRRLPRQQRVDLATLALLYDQPRAGSVSRRWSELRRLLRIGWFSATTICKWTGLTAVVLLIGLLLAQWASDGVADTGFRLLLAVVAAVAILTLGYWAWRSVRLGWRGRQMRRELRAVDRTPGQLWAMLSDMPLADMASQPLPVPGDHDSRYQLTQRLLDVLRPLGYDGIVVLLDRVDEPAVINSDPQKMKSLVWPLFNNKFLQQDGVGIKLLLPIELRDLLRKEDAAFFQRARLDKQHMVERLVWSGTMLYDLCSRRLQACREEGTEQVALTDLFEEEVTRQDLIDALDQMQQPRDAFKFLYRVIQEHCSNVPHDQPQWRIPRTTLEYVRKEQARRLQDMYRGVAPA